MEDELYTGPSELDETEKYSGVCYEEDCTGSGVVFDLDNTDAWVRSDEVLELDDCI